MFLTQPLHLNAQQQRHEISTICGERTATHGETLDRVSRLGGAIGAQGIAKDERVAILGYNSDRYVETIAAIAWADAVFVPLNWRWSVPEVIFGLTDCDAVALFVDSGFEHLVPELLKACPKLRVVVGMDGAVPDVDDVLDYESLIAAQEPVPDAYRRGDSLAGIFYTGGTTGRSKGVMLSHRNLMSAQIGIIAGYEFWPARGRMLYTAPMFHIAALSGWVVEMILGGSHVFLKAFDTKEVLRSIEEHRISSIPLVPTMLQMLIEDPTFADHDLSALTDIAYGGSAMTDGALARVREYLPTVRFRHGYGLTESSSVVSFLSHTDHEISRVRRSVGRVSPHNLVKIVDEADHDLPAGELGEICVYGENVMLGYWNRPEESEAALRGGWLHTGDIGRLDEEGYLYIVDRLKDMIVSGAENIYSSEVENAIGTHPSVASCAVIGVPDETWGERVHAVVVLHPGHELTYEELRAYCRTLIAGYKCPRSMQVVDALPLTPAGKINKVDLRQHNRPDAAVVR